MGAGRVGTALGVLWTRAGHRVVALSGREATAERAVRHLPEASFLSPADAAARADVVVLGVPDELVRPICEEIASSLRGEGAVVHLSGSLGLGELASAGRWGAEAVSVHPLQTCPSVERAVERLPGAAFAVTAASEDGYALGERLAEAAGGRPFPLKGSAKPLYHAAAVFASNYLTTVEAIAESLLGAAGVAEPLEALLPLARATLDNLAEVGPARALTGPAVRGDAGTVERNLDGLKQGGPEAIASYVALARAALELAETSGRLDPSRRRQVEEVLDRWT